MNNLKYKGILYFIAAVILATLYIQVYWNYRNYETGKQQLINDVQTSLDNAVDGYYTDLAKNRPFNLWKDSVNVEMKHRFAQGSTIYDTISKDKKLNIRVKNVPSKYSKQAITAPSSKNDNSIPSRFFFRMVKVILLKCMRIILS